jgi:hypothetical protein
MVQHIINSTKKAALWVGMVLFGAGIAGALSSTANAQSFDYAAEPQFVIQYADPNTAAFDTPYEKEPQFQLSNQFPFISNITGFAHGQYIPDLNAPVKIKGEFFEFDEEPEEDPFYSAAAMRPQYQLSLPVVQAVDMMPFADTMQDEPMHSGGYTPPVRGFVAPMLPKTGAGSVATLMLALAAAVAFLATRRSSLLGFKR